MKFNLFSEKLEYWIDNDDTKTLGELIDVFGEKSFGVFFLIMLTVPSLPFPTGGVTTFILLPATIIAALQMAIGRKTLWLPNKLRDQSIRGKLATKSLPFILKRVKDVEKISKPRMRGFLNSRAAKTTIGLLIAILAVAALIAPPFTGLDTLPSLGGVFISLAIIFEDLILALIGFIVGLIGIGILVAASSAVIIFFQAIF